MSIYASLEDIGCEHSTRCKRIRRIGHKTYEEDDSKPCTCGSSPIVYQHSGVFPSNQDKRGGRVDLAGIPPHITRDGRDNGSWDDRPWHPWLRLGVASGNHAGETVILTRKQVDKLRNILDKWLERSSKPSRRNRKGRE